MWHVGFCSLSLSICCKDQHLPYMCGRPRGLHFIKSSDNQHDHGHVVTADSGYMHVKRTIIDIRPWRISRGCSDWM